MQALLPEEQDETIRVDDENDTWRFLLYEPRGTSTCSTWNLDPLACDLAVDGERLDVHRSDGFAVQSPDRFMRARQYVDVKESACG